MPKHKDQRVGVFVDVQNLYYSAKQFYNAKVNFAHILKTAVAGRKLIRAIAYVIKADVKEEGNFFEALEKIGYDVRSKDLQTFYTGAKKGDWDVGIAMDIMRMASKLDVIVLVSGDGDFKDLLEHVKALGCRAEVIAFGKTSSSRLLKEADEMIDLGKDLSKALINYDPENARQKHEAKAGKQKKSQASSKSQNHGGSSRKHGSRAGFRHDIKKHRFESSSSQLSLIEKVNMDQPILEKNKINPKKQTPEKESSSSARADDKKEKKSGNNQGADKSQEAKKNNKSRQESKKGAAKKPSKRSVSKKGKIHDKQESSKKASGESAKESAEKSLKQGSEESKTQKKTQKNKTKSQKKESLVEKVLKKVTKK